MTAPRRVVVAGGGNGIGKAAALLFASNGADVHVIDFDAAGANSAVGAIRGNGGRGRAWNLDITDEVASEGVFRQIAAAGAIDTVITTVGIELAGATPEVSVSDWRRVIEINLTGTFIIARLALGHMLAHRRGSIILTSSVHALQSAPGLAAYAASKGGLDALTRALALEAAPHQVRVNSIQPGATDTPMLVREVGGIAQRDAGILRFSVNNPSQRVATPDEIASVIAFLASDSASFITGASIPIDGGGLAALNSGPPRNIAEFPIPPLARAPRSQRLDDL